MQSSNTIICTNLQTELNKILNNADEKNIFILTDTNSNIHCLPKLQSLPKLSACHVITIKNGDDNKNIDSLVSIWRYLSENGANRKSLMINLGGGVITDIGGFAASTFKRGISFINISTTLLGAVDAATGGKTGINFLGYKNEIGTFAPANKVLIDVDFFKTLDNENIRSGYAEMIKHSLIDSKETWDETLSFNLEAIDFNKLTPLLRKNISIKERVVKVDPKETGLRKALNLGHTFGHAFESLSYIKQKPVLHGYAVAWGLICELYLSHIKTGFPENEFWKLKKYVDTNFGKITYDFTFDEIIELMKHDKKNENNEINFTLLSDIGKVKINQTATKEEIEKCLNSLKN